MLRLCATAVVLLLVASESAPAQTSLERVRGAGRLRIGIDAAYPPFGIAEGGEFSGFDVEVAKRRPWRPSQPRAFARAGLPRRPRGRRGGHPAHQ